MGNYLLFGCVCIVLVRYPSATSCTGREFIDISYTQKITSKDNIQDTFIYQNFDDVFLLTENNRLDEKDPDSVLFNMILNNIRDREIIEEK